MYADRSSPGRKRSVMDRLGGGGGGRAAPAPDPAKRLREADGTWRQELYRDHCGIANSRVASINLMSQSIAPQQITQVVNPSSVLDLRDKLSGGGQHPQLQSTVQIPKPVSGCARSAKPVQKSVAPPTSILPVTKKVASTSILPITKKVAAPSASGKQSQEKVQAELSVDSLLKSLDLQKYLITFQAEEVDMKALVHMTEDDLKSLGIPMGPRKKILSALAARTKKPPRALPAS